MNTRKLVWFVAAAVALPALAQQKTDLKIWISGGELPTIAVPDFRGSGEAQKLMEAFNRALFQDLQDSGAFTMAAKSMYPLEVPQRPQDWKPPVNSRRQGPWFTDWSTDPVRARYVAIGYTAPQEGRLALFGWLFNVTQADVASGQMLNKLYFGDLSENGAKKVAHEFAADILAQFGIKSLFGSRIYFTRQAGKVKEIWAMDYDGSNQRALTRLNSTSNFSAVSLDGTRLAFTTYAKGNPTIMLMSLETGRFLPFFTQPASMTATPEFTRDGRILYSSTPHGGSANIYICNADGSALRRLSPSSAIEVEPKVNPRTGSEIVYTTDRSGMPQVYKMNLDGAELVRLTSGEGEAVNPSWHPDGQHIAFSWTKGYDPGNFNIFVMDVTTRETGQLTHGAGRNENPSWAPDGRHLVFSSNRSGRSQIYTMLMNGTQVRQLTFEGSNGNPVWSR